MPMVKKSITLTKKQDDWIKSRIESGDYGNDSEYVRQLVRNDLLHAKAQEQITRLIQEGIDSGISTKSMEDIRQDVLQRLKAQGVL